MAFIGLSNGHTDYVGRHFVQAPSTSVLRQEFYGKSYFEAPTAALAAGEFVAHTGAGVPLGRPSWGQLWPRGVR